MAPVELGDDFVTAPVATYAKLREQGSVHRAITPDGAAVWLMTRYEDVRAALADPRLSLDKAHARDGYQGFALPPALDANLLNMDAPRHTRLRRITAQAFRVHHLRPQVAALAEELIDEFAGSGHADLMTAYAGPLPIAVICELLGVPTTDRPDFRAWTDEMLAPSSRRSAADALDSLHRFLVDLVAAKRADPGGDLISGLLAQRDQERLTEDELTSTAFLMLFAGYENTVNLLGNGMAALLSHPDQLGTLRADPPLLRSAVDELLRFDPPPQTAIRRFPISDVRIGGVTVPAGETVLLSLVSAHHDPEVFTAPDMLDVTRGDNPHLAFGNGPHFCLGAPLARMEAEIGFETLLRRLPDLALAVPPDQLPWRASFRNRGLLELPVAFTAR
ncbi:MAG: cytochrome P450 [Saccharopolyspora sp.]|uniref:cytochrome P450 family protein n=1 Tax=Saccharopolyspora sp. TaxID=33915 RepID=UPI0025DA78D3|nr:cytochrome P450 [Saccharopolyspora sp.]MBQ6640104.1 cytochrome P450 [Saccharopolyspora sp.]